MIITRTPLRITLAGGGTDLPSYYEKFGGFVVSAAINKYIFIAVNRTFTDDFIIKYSRQEKVSSIDEIDHKIVREALRLHPEVGPALEIVSLADIPAGTGLGSSGSFTVGLLRSIYAFKREHVTAGGLAEEACSIEIERLAQPVGKQDQYIAAFGGLTCFEFSPGGEVRVSPLRISKETLHDLEEHLVMFFTGYSRDAASVLEDQQRRSDAGDEEMLANLHAVHASSAEIVKALEQGMTRRFGELLHDHWMAKQRRSPGISNDHINQWYEVARSNGAVGGKLVGAGGGGFLLFYADDPARLRASMAHQGLTEVRFFFDHDGSTVLVRD